MATPLLNPEDVSIPLYGGEGNTAVHQVGSLLPTQQQTHQPQPTYSFQSPLVSRQTTSQLYYSNGGGGLPLPYSPSNYTVSGGGSPRAEEALKQTVQSLKKDMAWYRDRVIKLENELVGFHQGISSTTTTKDATPVSRSATGKLLNSPAKGLSNEIDDLLGGKPQGTSAAITMLHNDLPSESSKKRHLQEAFAAHRERSFTLEERLREVEQEKAQLMMELDYHHVLLSAGTIAGDPATSPRQESFGYFSPESPPNHMRQQQYQSFTGGAMAGSPVRNMVDGPSKEDVLRPPSAVGSPSEFRGTQLSSTLVPDSEREAGGQQSSPSKKNGSTRQPTEPADVAVIEKYERLKAKYHRQREKASKKEILLNHRRVEMCHKLLNMIPAIQMHLVQSQLCFPSLQERALIQGIGYFGHEQPVTEVYKEISSPFIDPVLCGASVLYLIHGGASEEANICFTKELASCFLSRVVGPESKGNLKQRVSIPFSNVERALAGDRITKAVEEDIALPDTIRLLEHNAVSLHVTSAEEGQQGCVGFASLGWLKRQEGGEEEFLALVRSSVKHRVFGKAGDSSSAGGVATGNGSPNGEFSSNVSPPWHTPSGGWWKAISDWVGTKHTFVVFVGVSAATTESDSEVKWLEAARSATHPLTR